jgi:hypothetical protein
MSFMRECGQPTSELHREHRGDTEDAEKTEQNPTLERWGFAGKLHSSVWSALMHADAAAALRVGQNPTLERWGFAG